MEWRNEVATPDDGWFVVERYDMHPVGEHRNAIVDP
jgi:hypothetical protein